MNNNTLLLLLPFLMNGKGDMTGVLTEVLKNQSSAVDPMTLIALTMLSGRKGTKQNEASGTDSVKEFGGNDVLALLKILTEKKDQSV